MGQCAHNGGISRNGGKEATVEGLIGSDRWDFTMIMSPPTDINHLGNYGTQCEVINSIGTEQLPLFGKLPKIQLNVDSVVAMLS